MHVDAISGIFVQEVTAALREAAEIRGGAARRALTEEDEEQRGCRSLMRTHVLVTVAGRPELASGFRERAQW